MFELEKDGSALKNVMLIRNIPQIAVIYVGNLWRQIIPAPWHCVNICEGMGFHKPKNNYILYCIVSYNNFS